MTEFYIMYQRQIQFSHSFPLYPSKAFLFYRRLTLALNLTKPTRNKAPLIDLLAIDPRDLLAIDPRDSLAIDPLRYRLIDLLAIDPRGTGHGLNNEKEAFLSKGQRSGETCNGRIKRMNKLWRKHIMLTQVTIALVVAQDTNQPSYSSRSKARC